MPSSRDRQRRLARAKLDRQMARRAAALRRRRRIQAAIGVVVALLLVGGGTAWALGAFDHEPTPVAEDVCIWTPVDTATNPDAKDVGEPPTTGLPTSGTRPMTITTNQGDPITVSLDLASAPCAGASFAYLAGKQFFDNTTCHEITTEGALHCGDPGDSGQGGPAYSFYNENVPEVPAADPSASPAPEQPSAYQAGTVAMINTPPGVNGSQFLIFFKDFSPESPAYSVVGKVTTGLDVVEKIGALPTVDNGSGAKVKPETDVVVQSLTVGEPESAATPDQSTAPADGSPSDVPSADPAASASGRS